MANKYHVADMVCDGFPFFSVCDDWGDRAPDTALYDTPDEAQEVCDHLNAEWAREAWARHQDDVAEREIEARGSR